MWGNSAGSWRTYPKRRFSGGTFLPSPDEYRTRPRASILPSSGLTSPAMQLRRVVFPLPEGPNSAVTPSPIAASHSSENPGNRFVIRRDRMLPDIFTSGGLEP